MALSYNPTLLNAAASRLFIAGMREAVGSSYVPLIATVRKTTRKYEIEVDMGQAPAMEEFDGSIVFTSMHEKSVTRTMKKYTAGVAVDVDDFDDDQLGGFRDRMTGMGEESVLLPNYLLMDRLTTGDTATATAQMFDGQPYFDTAHPALGKEGGTQSNIDTGTGTTLAQIKTDLNTSIANGRGIKKSNGRYANRTVREISVVFPAVLREKMIEAINSQLISNTSNVSLRGITWKLIEDPQVEDDDVNDYYVLFTGYSLRPLVVYQRDMLRVLMEAANSGGEFIQEVKRWKSRFRGLASYGPWQRGRKVTNT